MCRYGAPPSTRHPEGHLAPRRTPLPELGGRRLNCRPGYQAQVFSPADRKTIRKTFRTLADARAWGAGEDRA